MTSYLTGTTGKLLVVPCRFQAPLTRCHRVMADTTVRNRTIRTGRTYIVRTASIIALSLLAAVVGCRSALPRLLQREPDRTLVQNIPSAPLPPQAEATILTAAYAEEVSAARDPAVHHQRRELLPPTELILEAEPTLTLSELDQNLADGLPG